MPRTKSLFIASVLFVAFGRKFAYKMHYIEPTFDDVKREVREVENNGDEIKGGEVNEGDIKGGEGDTTGEEIPIPVPEGSGYCPWIEPPENAVLVTDCGQKSKGEICTFKCERGFTMIGNDELICSHLLQWKGERPRCKEISRYCPPIEPPENGVLVTDCGQKGKGEICTFQCNHGFSMIGDEELICSHLLQWKGEMPRCENREPPCPMLNKINHGIAKCTEQFCQIFCNDGYIVKGYRKLTCENGVWNVPAAECVRRQPEIPTQRPDEKVGDKEYCPPLVISNNVISNGPCRYATRGESCKFKCKENILLEGKNEIFCTHNLKWSGEVPHCKNAESCTAPSKPAHGDMKCSDGNLQCEFSCNSEYRLDSHPQIKCNQGKWTGREPLCLKKCETPKQPHQGIVKCSEENIDCEFSCNSGYLIEGKRKITCRDGKWDDQSPTCKTMQTEYCSSLDIPDNLIWDGNCRKATRGESCKFKCKENMVLDGADELYCTSNLVWKGVVPHCLPKTEYCPALEIPDKVIWTGFCRNATVGELCKFKCEENFILEGVDTLFCTRSLKWNGVVPHCKYSLSCKTPDKPAHGDVQCWTDNDNTKCQFSCDREYRVDGQRNIMCHDGMWNGTQATCKRICATPQRPDHGFVKCSEENVDCEFSCEPGYETAGGYKIVCDDGVWNDIVPICKKKSEDTGNPHDCATIKKRKSSSETGTYTIWPKKMSKSIEVRCDMTTDNGGWTVFQRRGDYNEMENFFRTWEDYVKGFGRIEGEFWLGLDAIHAISSYEPQTLRIDMADFDGSSKHAKYTKFGVGGSGDNYKLEVNGYSGTAGDSLWVHNSMRFSTKDSGTTYCAKLYKGAWWYNWCHHSNLNGQNLKGKHTTFADGINWLTFRWDGWYYSLKSTEMKMRPRQY